MIRSRDQARIQGCSGFSILEIVAVLAIVAIMGSIAALALGGWKESGSLDAAARIMQGKLREARTHAVMNGVTTRFLVCFDRTDPERFLREIGIVVQASDDLSRWQAVDKGSRLPEGVAFVPQDSEGVAYAPGWLDTFKSRYTKGGHATDAAQVCNLPYPMAGAVTLGADGSEPWLYYSFDPSGRVSGNASGNFIVLAPYASDGTTCSFEPSREIRKIGFKITGVSLLYDLRRIDEEG